MRPHVIVELQPGVSAPAMPHWSEIITDKRDASDRLVPAIDDVLRAARVPVWVAREYKPQSGDWSPDETATGLDRVYRLILQRHSAIPPSLINEISLVPQVARVRGGEVAGVPLPPRMAMQASARTDADSRRAIHLDEAHRMTTGDRSITIAVLDTGVGREHPELEGVVVDGYDFVDIIDGHDDFVGDFLEADPDPSDDVGHGTHVSGIIAARGLAMPVGVAPRCRLFAVRVLGAMRQGEERVGAGLIDNINNAIKWAVDRGADIINMSLGVPHEGGGLPHDEVARYAQRKGVTIVAAAGNDGQHALYYPGALPGVIAVGAFGPDGDVASFSTYGRQIMVIAPGDNIYSAYLERGYAFSTGTSQATPFVTGGIALLKSFAREVAGASLSDSQVKHVLKHSSDKLDTRFKHPKAGYGRLNLRDALRLVEHRLGARRDGRVRRAA